MVLDLTKRLETVAPLSQAQFDGNYTLIEQAMNLKVDSTDPRLTNARTPTAHQHPLSDIPEAVTALAGKASVAALAALADTVSNLVDDVASLERAPQVLNGVGVPSNTLGFNGDFYIDIAGDSRVLYGPKGKITPNVWPLPGITLSGVGGTTFTTITLAALEAGAIAGTLETNVEYRITGTDNTAVVLSNASVPNVVQISSPTVKTRLLVDVLEGRVLSSNNPTWNYIFDVDLEDLIITDPGQNLTGNAVPGAVEMQI